MHETEDTYHSQAQRAQACCWEAARKSIGSRPKKFTQWVGSERERQNLWNNASKVHGLYSLGFL